MIDGKRTHIGSQSCHGIERHQPAVARRQIDERQRRDVALKLGSHLHDHVILVGGCVDRGNLSRAEGAVEGVLDLLGCDAERRRPVALDVHAHLRAGDLQVGVDIHQLGQHPELRLHLAGDPVEFVEIRIDQRELVQGLRLLAPDADAGRLLGVGDQAGNDGQIPAELLHHHRGRGTLVPRLESQGHLPVVERRVAATPADGGHERVHRRILCQDRRRRLLVAHHLVKGDILGRLSGDAQEPGIIGRDEALRQDARHHHGQHDHEARHSRRRTPVVQAEAQRALIGRLHRFEDAL